MSLNLMLTGAPGVPVHASNTSKNNYAQYILTQNAAIIIVHCAKIFATDLFEVYKLT